jgi:hypothetical protein
MEKGRKIVRAVSNQTEKRVKVNLTLVHGWKGNPCAKEFTLWFGKVC